MSVGIGFAWNGERNRPLDVYRPCPCGICSGNRKGVGYLSCSDAKGHGFTVWIQSEEIFRRLSSVFRKTRLQIGHVIDKSMGGTDDPSNLRAICSVCNEGARNLTLDRPTVRKLLIQIRRATGADQFEVLQWLLKKFPDQK
ncbi:MAG TPA: HNH endonuclease [Candidatus Dormibacteraeota bacterium]|nr:HNH endonuclease [Candidatus Dormibacteraeota bacterium]